MPGGKVAVYTGILQYTKDETGLAVVIGHEVAHALADHGNERMSQGRRRFCPHTLPPLHARPI